MLKLLVLQNKTIQVTYSQFFRGVSSLASSSKAYNHPLNQFAGLCPKNEFVKMQP